MNNKNFNIFQITYSKLTEEINYYLRKLYNKGNLVFSSASPHGHILNVIKSLYQSLILQIKIIINSYTMSDNNMTNAKIVRSSAILAGHIPTRFISSSGTLRLKYKVGNSTIIQNNQIIFSNKMRLRNSTNGLDYTIDLGGRENMSINVFTTTNFFVNILQGKWETATFTSDGSKNQSFQINPPSNLKGIENYNIEVFVNGEKYQNVYGLNDMVDSEFKAVITRTSFEGGLDIIFGGDGIGYIPEIGSIIRVNYLVSDGSNGNIFRKTINDFDFIDQPLDAFGNTVDVKNIYDIYINTDINFGSDGESIPFTKAMLPITSSNFVLATPPQYAYHIKKLGIFTHVNAYLDTKMQINIMVIPNIRLFKNLNQDYFNIDTNAFLLDSYERNKIDTYLKKGGTIMLSTRYRITTPKLVYYTMNIFYISYNDIEDSNVEVEVLNAISEYMLNLRRANSIPKKDIMDIIIALDIFDSFDFNFVSKANEEYHRDKLLGYNSNNVIGLDPLLGDISFGNDEFPVLKGGWFDRNNSYYDNDMTKLGLKTVNFFKKGTIDRKKIIKQ